jgi:hypothetical protein
LSQETYGSGKDTMTPVLLRGYWISALEGTVLHLSNFWGQGGHSAGFWNKADDRFQGAVSGDDVFIVSRSEEDLTFRMDDLPGLRQVPPIHIGHDDVGSQEVNGARLAVTQAQVSQAIFSFQDFIVIGLQDFAGHPALQPLESHAVSRPRGLGDGC